VYILEKALTRNIIGICGLIGSGKGTVGDILVNEYGYTKISFADRLKDSAATMFDWPRHMLEGDTPESRAWREQTDEFWSTELGREITPRLVLQLLGTDCMRKGFDDNIWLLIIKRTILENPDIDYVIPDVRFFNEADVIRDLGGEVWQVQRGEQPEWADKAVSDNVYATSWMLDYPEIHESEWRWMNLHHEFNRTVYNNGTKEALENIVRSYVDARTD
jgi:hypothetical protein